MCSDVGGCASRGDLSGDGNRQCPVRKRVNAVVEALGPRVASMPLRAAAPARLPAGASCGSRADADDVEDGEPAQIPGRDSPEVFTSPRGNHYLGRYGPFEQR